MTELEFSFLKFLSGFFSSCVPIHVELRGQVWSQFSSSSAWLLGIELGGGGWGLGVAASPLSAETSLRPFKSHLPPPSCALCCFCMGEEVLSRYLFCKQPLVVSIGPRNGLGSFRTLPDTFVSFPLKEIKCISLSLCPWWITFLVFPPKKVQIFSFGKFDGLEKSLQQWQTSQAENP